MHYAHLAFWSIVATVFTVEPRRGSASDFTFTVPVRLVNLPRDSRSGTVSCTLHTGPAGTREGGGTIGVGNGFGAFIISSGAYDGDVTVTADARPGVDPATVTHYSCAVSFVATVRGRDQQFAYYRSAAPGPALPLAPGPQSPRVEGAIR